MNATDKLDAYSEASLGFVHRKAMVTSPRVVSIG